MSTLLSRRQFIRGSSGLAAAGLLAACMPVTTPTTSGGQAEPSSQENVSAEPETIQLAVGVTQTSLPVITDLVAQFQEQSGDVVEVAELPPYVGFFEKIMTQIAAETAPDTAMLLSYWTAVLGKAGILLILDDLLEFNPEDEFVPSLLTYCQWQGQTHGLPLNTNVQGIIYNQELFDGAGITAPATADEAWTWDEFSAACQQLKDTHELPYAYGIYGGAPQGRLIQVYQNGRAIMAEDLTQSELDTPEAIEALEHIQSLFVNEYTAPEIWTAADPRFAGTEMFKAGSIAMFHGGQWHIPWAEENLTFEWGATYLQRGSQLATAPGGEAYVAFNQTRSPQLASDLVQFLTSAEGQQAWNTADFRIPSRTALLEAGAVTYPHHQVEMDLFVDHLQYGSERMLIEYYADGWSRTDAMLRQRTSEIATGQMDAATWAAEVAEEIRTFVAEGGF